MNEPDVLQRAARALRAAHTGEREGSGFTRARIMTSLHGKRRRQLLRWAVFSPLASLVLVGSAWAHSTGKWPVVWQAVTSVLVAWPPKADVAAPKTGVSAPPSQQAPDTAALALPEPPDTAALPLPEPPLPLPEPPAPAPEQAPRSANPPTELGIQGDEPPRRASTRRRTEVPRALERGAGPSVEEPKPAREPAEARAPADPELSKFRRAHDLHFRADSPREAIDAYAAYLAEFPSGRFVPEARYNTALNWIKLGDKGAARAALAPFAEGVHGDYRRTEARQLLEALK